MTNLKKQTQAIAVLHKTDVSEDEKLKEANRRYQAAFRARNSLLIADLQSRQQALVQGAEIVERMGNMVIGRKLRKAAEIIGEL